MASAKEVLERHRDRIMQLPDVIGIAITRCAEDSQRTCILVYTTTDEWPTELPKELEGYSVQIESKKNGFHISSP